MVREAEPLQWALGVVQQPNTGRREGVVCPITASVKGPAKRKKDLRGSVSAR